jgi:hypothetical protein
VRGLWPRAYLNMKLTTDLAYEIYYLGAEFGQLLMEEERLSEELGDAVQGVIIAQKYSMPSAQPPRRQLHSDKWFDTKKQAKKKFLEIVKNII